MLLGIFNVYSSLPLCLYWGLKMHKLTKLTKFTQGLTKVCTYVELKLHTKTGFLVVKINKL